MQPATDIFNRGCLVHFTISSWGARKKLSKSDIQGLDVDDDFYSATKYLVDRKHLKEITKLSGRARVFLESRSLPFPIKAVCFVPREAIADIDAELSTIKAKFDATVNEFCENYNMFREEAAEKLRSTYNPMDYPPNIRYKFNFAWQFFAVGLPEGNSSLLSPEVYEREKAKFKQQMDDFANNAVAVLRIRFQEMLTHIVERLSGYEKKIFRDSLVEKPREFIDEFRKLNICDDKELESLIDKTKAILNGVSPQALRDDVSFRNNIADQVDTVKNNLNNMIVKAPRYIDLGFDDDDE